MPEKKEQPTIETADLGHPFTESELARQCRAIYGAVAWPGKAPGFGVVVALDAQEHPNGTHIVLLDETDPTADLGELVGQCGALDLQYKPRWWLGDDRNEAARRFLMDHARDNGRRRFYVCRSALHDLPHPHGYMMATVRELMQTGRLLLKGSAVLAYAEQMRPEDVALADWGDCPPLEGLALAVCELMRLPLDPPKERRDAQEHLRMAPMGF